MSPTLISKQSGFALNAEQRSAVEHGEGPLLVVAGAGTGKTRVITERIRHLLDSDPGLAAESILGLTFTDKAAGEMKHRVLRAMGERARGVWLGTFHSFCLEKILRERNPDLQPIEDIDHRILLRRRIADLGLVIFRRLAEPAEFLKDFQTFFSRCQDELVTPDDYERYVGGLRSEYESTRHTLEPDARSIADQEIRQQEELARVYRVSDRLLRERHLATFGAQLLQAVELLGTDAAFAARLRGQYRYVLVDEFQDTNIAQLELLWLLAGGRRNIVAVGDDDQAIYRFRGASFGSFTIFLKRFCGVSSAEGAFANRFLVSLFENYRSTRRILRVAGEAISHNEKSPLLPPKRLTTQNPDGERIRVVEFASAEEEAHWVASEIERLYRTSGSWRSCAVLYRKHAHRSQLLVALRRRQIPFVIRKSSILSTTVVRDLVAWLRLIAVLADNVCCARVLAAPYWALEPRDLVRLAERAEKNRRSLWEELKSAAGEQAGLTTPARTGAPRFAEFVESVEQMRQKAKTEPASAILDQLIAGLGIAPVSGEMDRQHVDRLIEFVKGWQGNSERTRVSDFIEYLDYFDELEGDIQIEEEASDDAVQLMTVHAAKGLEFPHVFILRLSRHDFPSGARRPQFEFPAALMKEEQPKGDFQKQEERRLFYVALTRAQKRLTLSTIVTARKRPSPFLEDILGSVKIQRADIVQSAPKVDLPPAEEMAEPAPVSGRQAQLFPLATDTRAYSQIACWARFYHPPRPEPLELSASAIETYERCAMKYLFQYGWRLRSGPSAQMTFGNVMHTTIREFVAESRKRLCPTLEELLAIYEREWKSAGFPDLYQEEEYRKAGREQLEAFYRGFTAQRPDVLFQEKPFTFELDRDLVVSGRIDQVNRLDGRRVEIVDYKTGKVRSADQAANDMQLSIYALASREVFDLEPERVVFHYLMSGETVAGARDQKALELAKQKIALIADQIRAGEFPAKPGRNCGYCDFKPLCPAHEQ